MTAEEAAAIIASEIQALPAAVCEAEAMAVVALRSAAASLEHEAAVAALMKRMWGYRNDKRWRDEYEALRAIRERRGVVL